MLIDVILVVLGVAGFGLTQMLVREGIPRITVTQPQ